MRNICCKHLESCRYAVGSNMPGFMPDEPAEHFACYADAKTFFDELLRDVGVTPTQEWDGEAIEEYGPDGRCYFLCAI